MFKVTLIYLYNEAVTDSLTGLYHDGYFQTRLAREVEEAKKHRRFLRLLVIDLDQTRPTCSSVRIRLYGRRRKMGGIGWRFFKEMG